MIVSDSVVISKSSGKYGDNPTTVGVIGRSSECVVFVSGTELAEEIISRDTYVLQTDNGVGEEEEAKKGNNFSKSARYAACIGGTEGVDVVGDNGRNFPVIGVPSKSAGATVSGGS